MNDRLSEFIIAGIVYPQDAEQVTVIGRNGDMPVHMNDYFDTLVRYKLRRYPDQLGDEPECEVEKPVSLQVFFIQAYDRSLDTLGEGMTGSLGLSGEGIKALAPGWVLLRRNGTIPTDESSPQGPAKR